jgi:hypothetical protein
MQIGILMWSAIKCADVLIHTARGVRHDLSHRQHWREATDA